MKWFDFFKTRIFPLLIDLERFKNVLKKFGIDWKPEFENHLRLTCFLVPERKLENESPYLIPTQREIPCTKFGEWPDLPEGEHPVSSSCFICQLNMADFKDKLTTFGLFPQTGVLYFWYNHSKVIHHDVEGKKINIARIKTSFKVLNIQSIFECLTFDNNSWDNKSNIIEDYEISEALEGTERFITQHLCVGGQTLDLQGNYSASEDEMLLLQYTADEAQWWACFFMISYENLKKKTGKAFETHLLLDSCRSKD